MKFGGELLGSILAAAWKQFGVAWKHVFEAKRFRNFDFIIKNKIRRGAAQQYFGSCLEAVRSCLEAHLEAVQKFRFYTKNKIWRGAARQCFGSCLEAVRSCLEARLEAVQKFRFTIQNKISLLSGILPARQYFGSCLEAVRSCLEARLEAVQKFIFYIKNKIRRGLLGSVLAAAWKQFGLAWKHVSKRSGSEI